MLSKFFCLLIVFVGTFAFAEDPPAAPTPEPEKSQPTIDVEFKPSEEISEDKSVPFPVDI